MFGFFDFMLEADVPDTPLELTSREKAINIFKKGYLGKYPTKYFPKNTNHKHDKTIAELTIPDAERSTALKYISGLVKRLNDKQSEFTFIFNPKHNAVFANPNTKTVKENTIVDTTTVKESTEPQIGDMDSYGAFYLNELKNLPIVRCGVENGYTVKEAVDIVETMCMSNPLYVLEAISPEMYPTEEAYDNALIQAACIAFSSKSYNPEMIREAIEYPLYDIITEADKEEAESRIDKAKDAIKKSSDAAEKMVGTVAKKVASRDNPSGKSGLDRLGHNTKVIMTPVINEIKDVYDTYIGNKSAREAVIKNSTYLKLRRVFLKVLVLWKSRSIVHGFIHAALGISPLGFLFHIVAFFAACATFWKTARGTDELHDQKQKCINELELELKMVREKIEDAKHADDKKGKYQLMRLENKIEEELYRIKFGNDPDKVVYGKGVLG